MPFPYEKKIQLDSPEPSDIPTPEPEVEEPLPLEPPDWPPSWPWPYPTNLGVMAASPAIAMGNLFIATSQALAIQALQSAREARLDAALGREVTRETVSVLLKGGCCCEQHHHHHHHHDHGPHSRS
ncbi:MAG: RebB family R body protein [Acidobacteriota bacterium]